MVCAVAPPRLGASIAGGAVCRPVRRRCLHRTSTTHSGLAPSARRRRRRRPARSRSPRPTSSGARPRVTPALFAISAVAVYLAVPDTEETAALLGVVLPVALLGWPLRRRLARPGRRRVPRPCSWCGSWPPTAVPRRRRCSAASPASHCSSGLAVGTRLVAARRRRSWRGEALELVLAVVVDPRARSRCVARASARRGSATRDRTRAVVVASRVSSSARAGLAGSYDLAASESRPRQRGHA